MRSLMFLLALWMFTIFPCVGYAETFRVMLYGESFPPYFYAQGDKRTGIIKDLCSAIGEITGDRFEYVYAPFLRAQRMFDLGQVDMEVMVSPVWRKDFKNPGMFSIPHSKLVEVSMHREGAAFEVRSAADLSGKVLGIVRGYKYDGFDEAIRQGKIQILEKNTERELLDVLAAGRIDVVFLNLQLGLYWLAQEKRFDNLVIGNIVHDDYAHIRVRPEFEKILPRLNKAIKQLLESGVIDRIYAKYH